MPKGGKARSFDPEGSGYDYATAKRFGIKRNASGHLPSRAPNGQILKGRGHETYGKTVKGEEDAGHRIYKGPTGKYYSSRKAVKGLGGK